MPCTITLRPIWPNFDRVLDDVINRLGTEDRAAILLRFSEQRDLRSIGEVLGSNEDAAQKRVARALEKLRGLLQQRGIAFSAAALATVLTAEAVTAAPAGLAAGLSIRLYGRICGPKWHTQGAGWRVRYAWRPAATRACGVEGRRRRSPACPLSVATGCPGPLAHHKLLVASLLWVSTAILTHGFCRGGVNHGPGGRLGNWYGSIAFQIYDNHRIEDSGNQRHSDSQHCDNLGDSAPRSGQV
jgi:hypothetical protein